MIILKKGVFITIEGPNGVGKSSFNIGLIKKLNKIGEKVELTKEPTDSELGNYILKGEEKYEGEVFACLIAADRYYHIQKEIIPILSEGIHVVSDRYVESSLVLQRLDGLDLEFIWGLNEKILIPNLSIILTASTEILEARLAERDRLSRFERTKTRECEVEYYKNAVSYIKEKGFNTLVLENGVTPLAENVETAFKAILNLIEVRR